MLRYYSTYIYYVKLLAFIIISQMMEIIINACIKLLLLYLFPERIVL